MDDKTFLHQVRVIIERENVTARAMANFFEENLGKMKKESSNLERGSTRKHFSRSSEIAKKLRKVFKSSATA